MNDMPRSRLFNQLGKGGQKSGFSLKARRVSEG